MVHYICLTHKWPAVKVEATGDISISNRKVFPVSVHIEMVLFLNKCSLIFM